MGVCAVWVRVAIAITGKQVGCQAVGHRRKKGAENERVHVHVHVPARESEER